MNGHQMGQDFDPRIADWLEDDPVQAPRAVLSTVLAALPSITQRRHTRLPWRFPTMTRFALVGGAAAAVAAVAIGAFLLLGRPSEHVGTDSPAPSASGSAAAMPSLDGTFTSGLYGYTVRYPGGWRVQPATAVWKVDDYANFDRSLSDILGGAENFDGTSTLLGPGESFEQWYAQYDGHRASGTCGSPARQEAVTVDGASGFIDLHCATTYLETAVAKDGRVYVFTLWWPSSTDLFASMLASVRLGSGPGACGLITSREAADGLGNPGLGANPAESGSGAESTCIYTTGGGDVVMHVVYTNTGGLAAFNLVKSGAGVQSVAAIGTDAVFDPATATLYVAKGDALVAIKAGTASQIDDVRLNLESSFGKIVAGRI